MFDFAVVIPTVLRSSLKAAVTSVVNQDIDATINIVVGVDHGSDANLLAEIRQLEQPRRTITVVNPGYSTGVGRGGIFSNRYGGAIRTVCSYLGNSRFIAYLDDDNWYAPNHLSTLGQAIAGKAWAFSLRQFVTEIALTPLGTDIWESVGPGKGDYAERFGGFCDTSPLMLDVEKCADIFPLWAKAAFPDGSGEDRLVFDVLRSRPGW